MNELFTKLLHLFSIFLFEGSESIEDKDRSEKKPSVKIEKKQNIKPNKVKDIPFTHKWLAASLKAHSDKITGIDFSSNGKYLISCGLG